MYINPFVAGVLATIGAELLLIFAWAFYEVVQNVRGE